MSCTSFLPIGKNRLKGAKLDTALTDLLNKPLAFAGSEEYISATSRLPFLTADGSAILNVECFFFQDESSNEDKPVPLILFVHGVCSSAETLAVHNLVQAAKEKKFRFAVLELEGHGLSSGPRAVCADFNRLVGHVTEFVDHMLMSVSDMDSKRVRPEREIPFVLCGLSLGGLLSAYAAEHITKSSYCCPGGGRLLGVALVAPAVGADPKIKPNPLFDVGLHVLSSLAPSARFFLTPREDTTPYTAPKDSTRNYSGFWPLGTSRTLLDVTTCKVAQDLQSGSLSLENVDSLVIFGAEDDSLIPFSAIKIFHDTVKTKEKALIRVPSVGHNLMNHRESGPKIVDKIFKWTEARLQAVGQIDRMD